MKDMANEQIRIVENSVFGDGFIIGFTEDDEETEKNLIKVALSVNGCQTKKGISSGFGVVLSVEKNSLVKLQANAKRSGDNSTGEHLIIERLTAVFYRVFDPIKNSELLPETKDLLIKSALDDLKTSLTPTGKRLALSTKKALFKKVDAYCQKWVKNIDEHFKGLNAETAILPYFLFQSSKVANMPILENKEVLKIDNEEYQRAEIMKIMERLKSEGEKFLFDPSEMAGEEQYFFLYLLKLAHDGDTKQIVVTAKDFINAVDKWPKKAIDKKSKVDRMTKKLRGLSRKLFISKSTQEEKSLSGTVFTVRSAPLFNFQVDHKFNVGTPEPVTTWIIDINERFLKSPNSKNHWALEIGALHYISQNTREGACRDRCLNATRVLLTESKNGYSVSDWDNLGINRIGCKDTTKLNKEKKLVIDALKSAGVETILEYN